MRNIHAKIKKKMVSLTKPGKEETGCCSKRRRHRKAKLGRDVDVNEEQQPAKSEGDPTSTTATVEEKDRFPFLVGPPHPPKDALAPAPFRTITSSQRGNLPILPNNSTTSQIRMPKLTTWMLRVTSSVIYIQKRRLKPTLQRSFQGQDPTPSFMNQDLWRLTVWRTFRESTPTHLTG